MNFHLPDQETTMTKKLFFHSRMYFDFEWNDFKLRAGSLGTRNQKQISDGLKFMSSESIRNRFSGSKKEFSAQELKYLTELDGWNHYAIGIEEREGPERGIAVVRLVRSSTLSTEAEIAITIIDEYQKIGLGGLLMDCIILAAIERNIETLSFSFMPQNEGIIKLIERSGKPIQGPHTKDSIQLFIDLKTIDVKKIKQRIPLENFV